MPSLFFLMHSHNAAHAGSPSPGQHWKPLLLKLKMDPEPWKNAILIVINLNGRDRV